MFTSIIHSQHFENIMISEKQTPLLMMKYLFFENLICQDFITKKEIFTIFYQKFKILEYLNSFFSFLAYKDIQIETHSRSVSKIFLSMIISSLLINVKWLLNNSKNQRHSETLMKMSVCTVERLMLTHLCWYY